MSKYIDPFKKDKNQNTNEEIQEEIIPSQEPPCIEEEQISNEKEKLDEYPEIYKKEERIWIGTRRHMIMWKSHATALFLAILFLYSAIELSLYFIFLLIIPIVISFLKIREIKRNTFEITNKRLKMKVFKNNRFITSEVELYNVKHVNLEEKKNGKGYLIFVTNSNRFPEIRFPYMKKPSILHDKVRDIVEELKLERNKMFSAKDLKNLK
jgi:hypothetical protein